MRTWQRVADLALRVDRVWLDGLSRDVSRDFTRTTTVVSLSGGGQTGVGEDVNYDPADQRALGARGGAAFPVEGRWTLGELSAHLDGVDLFDGRSPSHPSSRDYRRWAVESAALDLALRQADMSLGQAIGRVERPVRFVVSRGLGRPPDSSRVTAWLAVDPTLRFKLDATSAWDDALVARLAACSAVETIDLKGAYRGTPVDQAADPLLYERVLRGLPAAWIEDPAIDDRTRELLEPHLGRVTWDAPIHSVADIEALESVPRMINIKPSRFGSIERLFDAYDHCEQHAIGMYGGGQFELGPGRGQIQLLAALWHADAPNDVAPAAFHDETPRRGLPVSPLDPHPARTGFRRADDES